MLYRKYLVILFIILLLSGCKSAAYANEKIMAKAREYGIDEHTVEVLGQFTDDSYLDAFSRVMDDGTFEQNRNLAYFLMAVQKGYSANDLMIILNKHGMKTFCFLAETVSPLFLGTETEFAILDDFKVDELARYFWYREKTGCSADEAVKAVNSYDDIPAGITDYTDLCPDRTEDIPMTIEEMLVNRQRSAEHFSYQYFDRDMIIMDEKYANEGCLVYVSVAESFSEMADQLYEDTGAVIKIHSAYISNEEQAQLYQQAVDEYGREHADKYVPLPGHSDHQTLLAIDIYEEGTDMKDFAETVSYDWIRENGYKYNFALRYPEFKEFITGYQFVPYHLHFYGGTDEAYFLSTMKITYEEFYYLNMFSFEQ